MPGRVSSRRAGNNKTSTRTSSRHQGARGHHNQPQPSQDTDSDEMNTDNPDEGDDDGDRDMDVDADLRETDGAAELERRASTLVRLALFTEYRRVPLKREDIVKKVLGQGNSRSFQPIFELAQRKFRKTFGMELVELKSRAELAEEDNLLDGEDGGGASSSAQDENGRKKKPKPSGSKTYILRSTLPEDLIELALEADDEIIEEEATEWPEQHQVDGPSQGSSSPSVFPELHGSILSWNTADQLGAIAIQNVILGLILTSGRVLSEDDLLNYLKHLHLPQYSEQAVVFNCSTGTTASMSISKYLEYLMKGGWIERQVFGGAKSKKGSKTIAMKRTRGDEGGGASNERYEWRWGPRAHVEMGEIACAKWIANFMVTCDITSELTEREKEELQGKVDKVYQGIEKVAGGKLRGLK